MVQLNIHARPFFFKYSVALRFGEGSGPPLQYACLENPMDGGAWWAAVHGVSKSRTRLNDLTFNFHFPLSRIGEGNGSPLQCSCLENPQGQGSLVGCRLCGRTESDTTEWLSSSSRLSTVQYYVASCVGFIPRLTLSDLRTNWTCAEHSQKATHSYVGNLLYFQPLCHPTLGTEAAPPPKEPTRTFMIITTVEYP